MATELIPLKSGQHLVTFVPKLSTDLPFFNLTSSRKDVSKVINYEGVDEAGHPIRWGVFQNASKEVGAPGTEAHQVWYLLIKPAIDEARRQDKTIPEIIPLGKIRECLRKVGWAAGGRQERDLIQALRQISFAGCVADLWFPSGETDEQGKQKYLQIKGSFSRLSIYAIGEYHVTEEELTKIEFKFDLEDVLYIKLDPLEVKMQQLQGQSQRLIDNQYLFSVKPAARRWYELMAGKIFGSVKNNSKFCEIRYSWYIKHHHTLKRYNERFRVVQQMNRVVADHFATGYLSKVEYRKSVEQGKELDFIIRYYPGEAAGESINRIRGAILNRSKKPAEQLPEATKPAKAVQGMARQGSEPLEAKNEALPALLTDVFTDAQELMTERLIIEFGVRALKAIELVKNHTETVKQQLAVFPYRKIEPKNKAGWFIQAVEQNYDLPEEYTESIRIEADRQKLKESEERMKNCQICDHIGFIHFAKTEHGRRSNQVRRCSHDQQRETEITAKIEKENLTENT
jgi:hypothetical protein